MTCGMKSGQHRYRCGDVLRFKTCGKRKKLYPSCSCVPVNIPEEDDSLLLDSHVHQAKVNGITPRNRSYTLAFLLTPNKVSHKWY